MNSTIILLKNASETELFSQALDEEFWKVVHSKFNGSIINFLDAMTVSCEDFIMMCKMGLRSEMPGDQCCREVFSNKVSFEIDSECYKSTCVCHTW